MKPLSRRALLRGAGGVAIALPWLEAMTGRRAHAQAAAPRRFISWFTAGGAIKQNWINKGATETAFTFHSSTASLEPHRQRLTIVRGLDMKPATQSSVNQHPAGLGTMLTGTVMPEGKTNMFIDGNDGPVGYATGISVDQVIAEQISPGTKLRSLDMVVRYDTSRKAQGLHPTNIMSYYGPEKPVPPIGDPKVVWTRLFTDLNAGTGAVQGAAARQALGKSVLDFVIAEYAALSTKVGAADKRVLDGHMTKIRDVETRLAATPPASASACKAPAAIPQYTINTDAEIPRTGKLMMDMLVLALACDLTRVAGFMWSDGESYLRMPWLNLPSIWHQYQHDGNDAAATQIYGWWVQQFAYLLEAMSAVNEGDRTLLQNSLVFWTSELDYGQAHSWTDMPYILAGNAGGQIRSGRYLTFPKGTFHNNLLVVFQNLFGITSNTFGDSRFCTGALTGIV